MSYILPEMPTWIEYVDDYGYYRLERYDVTYGNERPKVQHKNQTVKQSKQRMEKEVFRITRKIQQEMG